MTALLNAPITVAGTFPGQAFQFRETAGQALLPAHMLVQETFTYGSGGTNLNVFLQTSLDAGLTWNDVLAFTTLTTSPARVVWGCTSIPLATQLTTTLTDGTLANGTAITGVFGPWWRVKYISTGTYVATTLRVDAFANVGFVPAGVGA